MLALAALDGARFSSFALCADGDDELVYAGGGARSGWSWTGEPAADVRDALDVDERDIPTSRRRAHKHAANTPHMTTADADAAVELGTALIDAILAGHSLARVKELAKDAPLWFQAPETGWSALHAAAFREDVQLTKFLVDRGAVWNAGQ